MKKIQLLNIKTTYPSPATEEILTQLAILTCKINEVICDFNDYMTPEETEILPCPFCGNRPRLSEDDESEDEKFILECLTMGCPVDSTPWYRTKDAVIKLWNKRA